MGRTNFSAYISIKTQLLKIFREEKFDNNKLPPEAILAKRLGISLVTLREALMVLALEGYITKKHGSGNYLHPSVLDPTNRLDLGISFADSIRQKGYTPAMKVLCVEKKEATAEICSRFKVNEKAEFIYNEIIYTSDEEPCVYTQRYIPQTIVEKEFIIGDENWNIHETMWNHCGIQLAHSLSDYTAILPDLLISDKLGISREVPILCCKQLFYDVQDNPVLFNMHYFHPQRHGVRILQNWDLNSNF